MLNRMLRDSASKVHTLGTVSYTHLDVYKRQPLSFIIRNRSSFLNISPIGSIMSIAVLSEGRASTPVSYTHLDVYKRQLQRRQRNTDDYL